MLYESDDPASRGELLRLIFDRLKSAGRFDPRSLQATWERLEQKAKRHFHVS
jgi:hypothetical protein